MNTQGRIATLLGLAAAIATSLALPASGYSKDTSPPVVFSLVTPGVFNNVDYAQQQPPALVTKPMDPIPLQPTKKNELKGKKY